MLSLNFLLIFFFLSAPSCVSDSIGLYCFSISYQITLITVHVISVERDYIVFVPPKSSSVVLGLRLLHVSLDIKTSDFSCFL